MHARFVPSGHSRILGASAPLQRRSLLLLSITIPHFLSTVLHPLLVNVDVTVPVFRYMLEHHTTETPQSFKQAATLLIQTTVEAFGAFL